MKSKMKKKVFIACDTQNIKKAKKIINWRPKISFKKGLRSTIKYYNERAN